MKSLLQEYNELSKKLPKKPKFFFIKRFFSMLFSMILILEIGYSIIFPILIFSDILVGVKYVATIMNLSFHIFMIGLSLLITVLLFSVNKYCRIFSFLDEVFGVEKYMDIKIKLNKIDKKIQTYNDMQDVKKFLNEHENNRYINIEEE